MTAKRLRVLSLLMQSQKALSAYEIADGYEVEFGEPVPVITVYRVLEFMQSHALVHRLDTANKFIVCSHWGCSHSVCTPHFLICTECLKVEELSMSQSLFAELKNATEQAGFQLNQPQLEMNCICDDCSQKINDSNNNE